MIITKQGMKLKNNIGNKQQNLNLDYSTDSFENKSLSKQAQPHHVQSMFNELELEHRQYSRQVYRQLQFLIAELLKYPSSELAINHRRANRLGSSDMKRLLEDQQNIYRESNIHRICNCCGLKVQQKTISICTSFELFPQVGISTYLFFKNIKNLIILIFILGVIFSGFSLYTNIIEPSEVIDFDNYPKKLSYASKALHLAQSQMLQFYFDIEGWLIVGVVCCWWVTLFIMKCLQIQSQSMIDQQTATAADFSIMIENVPINIMDQKWQQYFDLYYLKLIQKNVIEPSKIKKFTIKKICKAIPYEYQQNQVYDQEIAELEQEILKKKQLFVEWIKEVKSKNHFNEAKPLRQKQYQILKNLKQRKNDKVSKKLNHLKSLSKKSLELVKTTVFISFQESQTANIIQQMNPHSFSSKIRYYLTCCKSANYFKIQNSKRKQIQVKISRAPEPEDIIWVNIGVPEFTIITRKLLTYFCTFFILGISFGSVYGLTLLQMKYNNFILSIAISLTITVINMIIGIVIRKLNLYQKNFTQTNHQTSLAIKSIFAQMINSILVPLITNLYIQNNLYDKNGLVYDIFFLSLTSAFVPPIIKIIDFGYFFRLFYASLQLSPYRRIMLQQNELNNYFELKQFQIGYQYIYFMDLYFFTCFYVTLQPCIIVTTILGFIFMYWAEKYCLLNRCKRPTPSSAVIAEAIGQLVAFGSIILSLGAMTWLHFLVQEYSSFRFVSHLISLGLGVLFFILPFNSIFNALCHVPDQQNLNYEKCRGHLTTEYDRQNPATSEAGILDYIKYIQQKKKDISNAKQKGDKIQENYLNNILQKLTKPQNKRQNFVQLKEKPIYVVPASNDLNLTEQNLVLDPSNLQFFQPLKDNQKLIKKAKRTSNRKSYSPKKWTKQFIYPQKKTNGYSIDYNGKIKNQNNPYECIQF